MEVDLGSSLTADLEVINNSTKCPIQLPSVPEFVGAMSVEIMGMVAVAGITSIYICLGYYRNLAEMIRRTPKQFLSRTLILCGVYQIVAASSLVSMLVPRAVLICDTVSHFAFIFCAYQITCLFIDYVGGESNFIKQADDQGFHLRTPPCCCCCFCCVPSPITKRKFTFIRLLIIQFLFVQGIVFIALNIIYVESVELFDAVFLFFVPVFVASIILGVWGLNILTKMMAPTLPELNLRGKYISLQLVLMMNKIQPAIGNLIVANCDFPCNYPMTPMVYKNVIVQLLIVIQMAILSSWAQRLYRKPTKYAQAPSALLGS